MGDSDKIRKIEKLQNRHCSYVSDFYIPYRQKLMFNTCLKEEYDETYSKKSKKFYSLRKLLLSEIFMLTEFYKYFYSEKHPVVISVSAAPGTEILLLRKLFPRVLFLLFDIKEFNELLLNEKNVKIKVRNLTINECVKLRNIYEEKGHPILFISNMRTIGGDLEENVKKDLHTQKSLAIALNGVLSLLKFRFPYNLESDSFTYLDGDILFSIWSKSTSGETRLLVEQSKLKTSIKYNTKNYEQILFFHNKYTRELCMTAILENEPQKIQNYIYQKNLYCPCYDCISELKILDEYVSTIIQNEKLTLGSLVYFFTKFFKSLFKSKPEPIQNIDNVFEEKCFY